MKERHTDIEVKFDGKSYCGTRSILSKGKYSYQTVRYRHLEKRDSHEYKNSELMLMPGMAEVLLGVLVRQAEGIEEE